MTTLVHISDLHFGRDADLDQVRVLEKLIPTFTPAAIVVSGDLTQRARHGEFQRALVFVERLRQAAPVLVVPGNHDVQWWETPFDLFGAGRKYRKYRQYFGAELSPTLELPGVTIASVRTCHGVAAGSLTWNLWRDTAVKGHLPATEIARVKEIFQRAPAQSWRLVVTHHNILRGEISQRMGLARWRSAQRALVDSGADMVLCGHDHQEGVALLDGATVVVTASTHTRRTRGHRPSAFYVVELTDRDATVRPQRWNRTAGAFEPSPAIQLPRRAR